MENQHGWQKGKNSVTTDIDKTPDDSAVKNYLVFPIGQKYHQLIFAVWIVKEVGGIRNLDGICRLAAIEQNFLSLFSVLAS